MGLYVGLTGCRLGASDLMQTGLATHFVNSDRLGDLESEIIKNCPPPRLDDMDHTEAKKAVNDVLDHFHATNPSQPDETRSILSKHSDDISAVFGGKASIEDIYSSLHALRLSKTQSEEWIDKTLGQLNKQPPTSLKLTYALLEHAEKTLDLDLQRCLEAEYRLMMRCMAGKSQILYGSHLISDIHLTN